MISSEKSNQNLSDYNKFLFKKRFEVNKKQIFSSEKIRKIQVIVFVIMLTHYSERIFNQMRYTSMDIYIYWYIVFILFIFYAYIYIVVVVIY